MKLGLSGTSPSEYPWSTSTPHSPTSVPPHTSPTSVSPHTSPTPHCPRRPTPRRTTSPAPSPTRRPTLTPWSIRRFWPQSLNFVRTPSSEARFIWKHALIIVFVVITTRQFWTETQPAWSNSAVSTKYMQSSPTKTEMLNHVKYLHWFLFAPIIWLFFYDEIDVNIGVNKIPICTSFHCSFDTHKAMLLKSKKEMWDIGPVKQIYLV